MSFPRQKRAGSKKLPPFFCPSIIVTFTSNCYTEYLKQNNCWKSNKLGPVVRFTNMTANPRVLHPPLCFAVILTFWPGRIYSSTITIDTTKGMLVYLDCLNPKANAALLKILLSFLFFLYVFHSFCLILPYVAAPFSSWPRSSVQNVTSTMWRAPCDEHHHGRRNDCERPHNRRCIQALRLSQLSWQVDQYWWSSSKISCSWAPFSSWPWMGWAPYSTTDHNDRYN